MWSGVETDVLGGQWGASRLVGWADFLVVGHPPPAAWYVICYRRGLCDELPQARSPNGHRRSGAHAQKGALERRTVRMWHGLRAKWALRRLI